MKSVRFHLEAEQELLEHEAWYRQRSEVAAQGFVLELEHAIAAVRESPEVANRSPRRTSLRISSLSIRTSLPHSRR